MVVDSSRRLEPNLQMLDTRGYRQSVKSFCELSAGKRKPRSACWPFKSYEQAMKNLALSTISASYAKVIDMNTVTVSPKFQVVIPLEVRRRMQLQPGTQLMVVELNGALRMFPVTSPSSLRGIARGIDTNMQREPDRAL